MIGTRLQYLVLGTAGGLAFWALSRFHDLWQSDRLLLGIAVFAVVFFGGALAMLHEAGLRRALAGAAGLGVPVALLALWKSTGFESVTQMLAAGHAMVALTVVATLPVPFLIARASAQGRGWADYRILFLESWNIVVRYAAAWLFVGVVWIVLLLGARMLDLVGVTVLTEILRHEIVVWLVCGAALGLGLSVVCEMSEMVSPYLLLRLLRLLLPVVLGLVVVFVLAIPMRGISHLFGGLSASGVLIGMALAAISLVSIAVDQDDVEAVHGPLLAWAGRGLALLLPVLGGLAAWAVKLRVEEYGWTPDRVMAAAAVLVILGYAALYALAVLTGRAWMGWIRRANIAMAGVMIGLGVLWLTPLISPERISATSQLERFEAGRIGVSQLPLWELGHDWGKPGLAALAELERKATDPAQSDLATQLANLKQADSRFDLPTPADADLGARAERLRQVIAVLPEGAELPDELWLEVARMTLPGSESNCADHTAAGNPRCALVQAEILPDTVGDEVLLLSAAPSGRLEVDGFSRTENGKWGPARAIVMGPETRADGEAALDALVTGGLTVVPSGIMALDLGGARVTIAP